eukprot:6467191-Amphidinium_carterae.1
MAKASGDALAPPSDPPLDPAAKAADPPLEPAAEASDGEQAAEVGASPAAQAEQDDYEGVEGHEGGDEVPAGEVVAAAPKKRMGLAMREAAKKKLKAAQE